MLERLKQSLIKTKENIANKMNQIFASFRKVDEAFLDELEEILISSDVSVSTSEKIKNDLRNECKLKNISSSNEIVSSIKEIIKKILSDNLNDNNLFNESENKKIILVIGINGVGKTTSIAKLANVYKKNSKKVLVVAGDTFRAAATEQLTIWSNKIDCSIVSDKEGADPGSVVFRGVSKLKSEDFDIMICDTAGRLHNKSNLMDELGKINRVIDKNISSDIVRENILVLDASTGQNMMNQVEEFSKIINISGLILTKLDGTAKGGAIISVRDKFNNLPIKYICTGESLDDICEFSSDEFVDSILNNIENSD